MCRRRWTDDSGFAVLETLVAVLVLSFLVVGLARLTVAHERMMADLESWCADDPVYYALPSANELERLLGYPAQLLPTPAPEPGEPPPDGNTRVTVLRATRELVPPSASATVFLERR